MIKGLKILLIVSFSMIIFLTNMNILKAANYTETVDGNGFYFSTGEAYPSKIQLVGYNARDNLNGKKTLYLNLEFTTLLGTETNVDFQYMVEIFDGTGILLGGVGNTGSYETLPSPAPTLPAQVTFKEIELDTDLTASHSIVATVSGYTY